jgi:hypothetical protein
MLRSRLFRLAALTACVTAFPAAWLNAEEASAEHAAYGTGPAIGSIKTDWPAVSLMRMMHLPFVRSTSTLNRIDAQPFVPAGAEIRTSVGAGLEMVGLVVGGVCAPTVVVACRS